MRYITASLHYGDLVDLLLAMNQDDILDTIRATGWAEFSGLELLSTSLVQLLELGVIRGVANDKHMLHEEQTNI